MTHTTTRRGFTQDIVKKCHSRCCRPQDSGICRYDEKRDPRLQGSGMTGRSAFTQSPSSSRNVSMRDVGATHTLYPALQACGVTKRVTRGFTLIELLVVVVIIAILAAIALPQYQKAVLKARVAKIQTVINEMDKAVALYIVENGDVPISSFDKLAIGIEGMFDSCTDNSCSFDNGKMGISTQNGTYQVYSLAEHQLGRFEVNVWHSTNQQGNLIQSFFFLP